MKIKEIRELETKELQERIDAEGASLLWRTHLRLSWFVVILHV